MQEFNKEELEKLKILLTMPEQKLNRLVRIADEDEKWEWLWTNLRKFGLAIFTIVALLAALRSDLASLISWAFGKGGSGGGS